MVQVTSLWLPIFVSAALVFVVSSVSLMLLGYHRADYGSLPAEDDVQAALRKFNLPTGDFELPHAQSQKDSASQAFREKLDKGPVVIRTVMPSGGPSMARNLALWFLYCVVVGLIVGDLAGLALSAGTAYRQVFRFVSTAAFAGYVLGLWQMSIWYNHSWATTIRSSVDGLVYVLLTAGTFGGLWPR